MAAVPRRWSIALCECPHTKRVECAAGEFVQAHRQAAKLEHHLVLHFLRSIVGEDVEVVRHLHRLALEQFLRDIQSTVEHCEDLVGIVLDQYFTKLNQRRPQI